MREPPIHQYYIYTVFKYSVNYAEFTEQNCAIGFLRGDDFIPLTNFIFRFVCKVSSPHVDNVDYNGFMVQVKTCTGNGKEEKGYVHSLCVLFSIL